MGLIGVVMNDHQQYVVGFAFNELERVLLVEKKRPDWQKGLLNGIGGKIEPGETPAEAMDRECHEETGLRLKWTEVGLMRGANTDGKRTLFECFIYYAKSEKVNQFQQMEDEPLSIWNIGDLSGRPVVANLNFLIPFMLCEDRPSYIYLRYA
jgi:8-oxo-dGTP diphosphatase